jgi:hypothetical protein
MLAWYSRCLFTQLHFVNGGWSHDSARMWQQLRIITKCKSSSTSLLGWNKLIFLYIISQSHWFGAAFMQHVVMFKLYFITPKLFPYYYSIWRPNSEVSWLKRYVFPHSHCTERGKKSLCHSQTRSVCTKTTHEHQSSQHKQCLRHKQWFFLDCLNL